MKKVYKDMWNKIIFTLNYLGFEGLYFDVKIKRNEYIRIRIW